MVKIQINLTNKIFYVFVFLGVAILFGIGVYAFNSGVQPNVMGHSSDEVNFSNGIIGNLNVQGVIQATGDVCTQGKCLSTGGGSVTWANIQNKPAGFNDGIDNITRITCNWPGWSSAITVGCDLSCPADGCYDQIVFFCSSSGIVTNTTAVNVCAYCSCGESASGGMSSGSSSSGPSYGGSFDGPCFASDELVLTPKGYVKISELKQGELVVSFNEESNSFTTSVVDEVIVHDGDSYPLSNYDKYALIELTVEINGKYIPTKVTENHPYYDIKTKKYKLIRDFEIGDLVKSIDGYGVIISKKILINGSSSEQEQKEIVYNLHLRNGPSNYIVNGIVVHNAKGDGGGPIY